MTMPTPTELAKILASLPADKRAAAFDAYRVGLDRLLGLKYETVADDRVVATLEITDAHLQPYGLVHGGVYAAMVESVCSVGAAMQHLARGDNVVGLENTTRFVRGTRVGARLRAEATPVENPPEAARRRACWRASITDEAGVVCATGQLVLAILAPGTSVGGEAVTLPNVEVLSDENPT